MVGYNMVTKQEQLTRDPHKLFVHSEIKKVIPEKSERAFSDLKNLIHYDKPHVKKPIIIAFVEEKETIIDGHNRRRAVIELMDDGMIPNIYEVPIIDLGPMQLEEAKNEACELFNSERTKTEYLRISTFLKRHPDYDNEKLKLQLKLTDINPIKKVRSLDALLVEVDADKYNKVFPKFVVNWVKLLREGEEFDTDYKDYATLYNKLLDGKEIQNQIDVISNKDHRAKMWEMFFEEKFKKIKTINEAKLKRELDKLENPNEEDDEKQKRKDAYYKDFKAVQHKVTKLEEKYSKENVITTFYPATQAKFDGFIKYGKEMVDSLEGKQKCMLILLLKEPKEEELSQKVVTTETITLPSFLLTEKELQEREAKLEAKLGLGSDPNQEKVVLRGYHSFLKTLKSEDKVSSLKDIVPIEDLEKATLNDELIIDKKLTLRHPLNDPRTKPQRRRFYLMQEQLMIDLAQIEREEAKEEEQNFSDNKKMW